MYDLLKYFWLTAETYLILGTKCDNKSVLDSIIEHKDTGSSAIYLLVILFKHFYSEVAKNENKKYWLVIFSCYSLQCSLASVFDKVSSYQITLGLIAY